MTDDRTLLDVISDVTTELRHVASFRTLLRPLDEREARAATGLFIEFLYRMLNTDPPATAKRSRRVKR
jgi:hypothetical protein